jgi:hypothetical protein
LLGALALRIASPNFFPNVHTPDELFQYLEQGHRLAFGYGVLTWEWVEDVRSWLLPGFLGSLMWATAALGGGPTAYLTVIAAVLSAISLSIVAVAFFWAKRLAGVTAAYLAGVITAIWFELVYFGSKSLTEVLAASILFSGTYLLCSCGRPRPRSLFFGGALLGLTLVLRMHLLPAILIVAIAGCRMSFRDRWLPATAGGAAVVVAAGMLDWVTLGAPFQSLWLYFGVVLLEGRASQFGTWPWYGYIGTYVLVWSGFLVPMAILALVGARRAPLLLIVPIIIVASHSMVGHKEYRYVFPALPFVLTLAAIGSVQVVDAMARAWPKIKRQHLVAATIVFWAATSAVLSASEYYRHNLYKRTAEIAAFGDLHSMASTCAVGLIDVSWWRTGGYTYLHRDIPIYIVRDLADLPDMHTAFNAALAPAGESLDELGYFASHRPICVSSFVTAFASRTLGWRRHSGAANNDHDYRSCLTYQMTGRMISTGSSSGGHDSGGRRATLSSAAMSLAPCQPAWSRMTTARAPFLTAWATSAKTKSRRHHMGSTVPAAKMPSAGPSNWSLKRMTAGMAKSFSRCLGDPDPASPLQTPGVSGFKIRQSTLIHRPSTIMSIGGRKSAHGF